MRRLVTNRLIRIYTVCHTVIRFLLKPFLQQWKCPNSEIEESMEELGSERANLSTFGVSVAHCCNKFWKKGSFGRKKLKRLLILFMNFNVSCHTAHSSYLERYSTSTCMLHVQLVIWRLGGCGFESGRAGSILSWRLIMKYFLQSLIHEGQFTVPGERMYMILGAILIKAAAQF